MDSIPLTCAYCATFLREPRPSRRAKQRFCNMVCRRAFYAADGKDKPCEHCGGPVILEHPYRRKKQRFCSRACYIEASRHRLVCQYCGAAFYKRHGKSHGKDPLYCGTDCQHAARRKPGAPRQGISPWRRQVRQRDIVCQGCGATTGLQAHHILDWSLHPERRFDVANGILLCADCHQERHPGVAFISQRDGAKGSQVHYCRDCGTPIGAHTKTGCCHACSYAHRRPPRRTIR